MIGVLLLISGFLFSFYLPGIFIFEKIVTGLPLKIKIPLSTILSLVVSTYLVYFTSLLFGFNRLTIFFTMLPFFVWAAINHEKIIKELVLYIKVRLIAVVSALAVGLLFFVALYPGIFTFKDGYFVMSSSNWQDTAMHQGIIESISQGNFPPQAPYYAGVPLNYYYFTDLHGSILETLYGKFFPRVIVYDNPIFPTIISLLVFTLSYEVFKKKIPAFFAAITVPFVGNYMFYRFFVDIWKGGKPLELIANNGYSIDFGKMFQVSPFADYFLQNRSAMAGLDITLFIFILILFFVNKEQINYKGIFFLGVISGLLYKFQFFATIICVMVFYIYLLINIFKIGFIKTFKAGLIYLLAFAILLAAFLLTSPINNSSVVDVFIKSFSFGPWDRNHSLLWYMEFISLNLGAPFIIGILGSFFTIKKTKALLGPILILSSMPFISVFTIANYDMLKFFYFAQIFTTILCFGIFSSFVKNRALLVFISLLVFITSSFSGLLNLGNSYLNKNIAYSYSEYLSGLWLRKNSAPRSVFIDYANLHSPVSEIAGRLRVLSYINWPYSHGYNTGTDNVFTRLSDIETIYENIDNEEIVIPLLRKYKVNYIYYGNDERNKYPDIEDKIKNLDIAKVAYTNGAVSIYEVNY